MNVPDGWRVATLGEVTRKPQKVDPGSTGRTSVHYVDIGLLDGPAGYLGDAPEIPASSAPSRCRQIIQSGDTLYSTVRPYLRKIALVGDSLDGEFASTGYAVLRPTDDVDPRYVYLFTQSRQFEDSLFPLQKGVSYPAVLDKEVRSRSIWFPELAEQRRIVEMVEEHLAHLDAANTSLAQVEKRVTAFEAAALEAHFGTSAAPEATVPLGDLIDTITAGKSLGAASARAAEGEWGIIKVSAMTWGEFRPDENKAIPIESAIPKNEIRSGDLLVSRANTHEYVGASVLVDSVRPRLLLSDKSLRVTPRSEVPAEWLWRALQAPSARQQIRARATGTKDSMRNISQSALRAVRLPKTHGTSQRDALSKYRMLSGASKRARAELQRQHTHSQALRRATLTAAFSGRLTTTTDPRDLLQDAVPR